MEIFDTSNLSYNTSLGETTADSGSGPPAVFGWIRTGHEADVEDVAGLANCLLWTSSFANHSGSTAIPSTDWEGPSTPVSPWVGHAFSCQLTFPSWCVED